MSHSRRLAVAVAVILLSAARPEVAHADERQRITVIEENDSVVGRDEHYTQGLRLSYLGPDVLSGSAWNGPFAFLGGIVPIFPATGERSRRYAISLGQSIFTPQDTDLQPPDSRDRPYAGWLYMGVSLLQDTDRRLLEHLELQLGVVGPAAFGKQAQNDFHQFIGSSDARGWSKQIQNEPGIVLSYERKWRMPLLGDGRNGIDFIPELGASIGNVFTYGVAGGLLRVGKNLQADYGPPRIRPALSGTDYFNADYLDGNFGFYAFVGAQGRAVGQNIFLDGNSFRTSRSVDKKTLVADLQAGVALFWSPAIRLVLSVVHRTEEFEGQRGHDLFGSAGFTFSW